MKWILTTLFIIILIKNVFAQSPEEMSYQAVIRNNSNQLVINQSIGMKISILQGTANGTVIYQETYNPNPQTNANGLITVEIGAGIPITGTFVSIDWSAGPYFIKTETDPNGGTNYTITGTSQILSVPYALHAKTAETVTGGISETDPVYIGSEAAKISTADIAKLSNLSGNNTGDQDLSGLATTASVTTSLSGKVDKVTGKGLSTEDYTTAEQTKLTGIATGAEVNVQADWKQVTSIADDYIKNKPVNIDEDKTDDVTTSGNQTITGNKTFTSTITIPTPVNATDAANKAYVDAIKEIIYDELLDAGLNGIVKDIDDNTYKTVKIGDQIWMAENLKTTKYQNGDYIGTTNPYDLNIEGETSPKYQWAYDGDESNVDIYGRLYTWYVVTDNRNVCPIGWHVANYYDWTALEDYLGGNSVAGGKLKEKGTLHWYSPNTGATNESGFTALPSGSRNDHGQFVGNGDSGWWWSGPTYNMGPRAIVLIYQSAVLNQYEPSPPIFGYSIRCIKD